MKRSHFLAALLGLFGLTKQSHANTSEIQITKHGGLRIFKRDGVVVARLDVQTHNDTLVSLMTFPTIHKDGLVIYEICSIQGFDKNKFVDMWIKKDTAAVLKYLQQHEG